MFPSGCNSRKSAGHYLLRMDESTVEDCAYGLSERKDTSFLQSWRKWREVMGTRTRCKLILLITVAIFAVLILGGQAWAEPYYAGNYRDPGYGVKAGISTPSSMPTVTNGVVANYVGNYDYGYWIGVGWVQGDGYTRAPDGAYWPTVPTSYEESNCNGYYFEYQYSAQPLNYTRTYEVVYTGSNGVWRGIIAGSPRFSFGPYTTPTLVEALTELSGSTQPHTRASFNTVQFKGLNSYMNFDQDWRQADNPPYAAFNSYYKYTCYNGM